MCENSCALHALRCEWSDNPCCHASCRLFPHKHTLGKCNVELVTTLENLFVTPPT